MGGIVAEMVVVVVVVVACVYALIMRKVGKVGRNGTRGSLECEDDDAMLRAAMRVSQVQVAKKAGSLASPRVPDSQRIAKKQ
jgi:hypothetical protein